MSASPTRIAQQATPCDAETNFPLHEGNRVLESVAQQQALGALLAFSALHEQIRKRRAEEAGADWDLFQTERFFLGEVLQLICDRTQAITGAEGVVIALSEGSEILCRAASGMLLVERGAPLAADSEFLRECLESGRILRCDDCLEDERTELDVCRLVGARSAVLIPLRGHGTPLGVLQAFSRSPFAFSDDDVRCFDLFAELVLSALRPEDEDRRLNWLTDVADEILRPKVAASEPVVIEEAPMEPAAIHPAVIQSTKDVAPVEFRGEFPVPELAVAEPIDSLSESLPEPVDKPAVASTLIDDLAARAEIAEIEEDPVPTFLPRLPEPSTSPEFGSSADEVPVPAFLSSFTLPPPSRSPGLSVVMVLMVVAALFSAGVWWGMRSRGTESAKVLPPIQPATESAPVVSSSAAASDNLLDPMKLDTPAQLPSPASESRLAVLPKITGLRHWSSAVGSTVVIDMEDQVPYEVHRLTSPERIYFDLHDTALTPALMARTIDIGDASLTRVRVAQPVAGVTRVVLDTKDGSNFSVSMESSPYRLIVQLRGSERVPATSRMDLSASAARSLPKQAALSPLPLRPEDDRLRAKTGRFRIVLDAGHGGWDLGTVGRQGLLEKDLVLDVTERLGRLLRGRLGSEVVFTRTTDAYLPLEQRAEVANQAQADLFVSVHANYSSATSARGVETYYTNFFSPPGSKEIETRENGTTPRPVPVSLSAGELHEKIEESRLLAASVQRSLYSTLAVKSPGIRNRGVKDSAFLVLTGTTMPAVLTEISFVSSPADERNLQSEAYRQQIAEALYKGIAQYEAGSHRIKMAQVRQTTAQQ